jgi:hypothetical protein
MKTPELLEIECEILACKKRLKELEPYIDGNNALAVAYNQTLVKKAVLVNEYKKLQEKKTIIPKIKRFFTFDRRKKLICDYFMK